MSIVEWLSSGNRRCECENVILYFYKCVFYTTIWSSDWVEQMVREITGNVKKRKHISWSAKCTQCNKLYFATRTRKKMIQSLETIKIPYEERKANVINSNKTN